MLNKFISKYPLLEKEDLYQEGLIVLYECMQNHNESLSSFTTYYYMKLNYHFLDLHRQNQKQIRLTKKLRIQSSVSVPLPSFDRFLMDDILQLLTPKQAKWFHYHILENRSYPEIATLENTTIDAIKGWAREAKKKIAVLLRTYEK